MTAAIPLFSTPTMAYGDCIAEGGVTIDGNPAQYFEFTIVNQRTSQEWDVTTDEQGEYTKNLGQNLAVDDTLWFFPDGPSDVATYNPTATLTQWNFIHQTLLVSMEFCSIEINGGGGHAPDITMGTLHMVDWAFTNEMVSDISTTCDSGDFWYTYVYYYYELQSPDNAPNNYPLYDTNWYCQYNFMTANVHQIDKDGDATPPKFVDIDESDDAFLGGTHVHRDPTLQVICNYYDINKGLDWTWANPMREKCGVRVHWEWSLHDGNTNDDPIICSGDWWSSGSASTNYFWTQHA